MQRIPVHIPKPPTTYHDIYHPSADIIFVVSILTVSCSWVRIEKAKKARTLWRGAKKSVIRVYVHGPDRLYKNPIEAIRMFNCHISVQKA
jgi:hypothetical protein